MRKIEERTSLLSKLFSNRIFLLLWAIGCLVIGIRLIRSAMETKQAFLAKQQAEERLKQEETKGLELLKKLDQANSPLEEERRIRDELNMQKPGEIILQIPSPTP